MFDEILDVFDRDRRHHPRKQRGLRGFLNRLMSDDEPRYSGGRKRNRNAWDDDDDDVFEDDHHRRHNRRSRDDWDD